MSKENFNDIEKILETANTTKRNITKSLMTKYELDCILNQRTIQLANGAYPFVSKIGEENISEMKIDNNIELRRIAIEELKEGVLPLMIKRTYPNKKTDYIKVKDMDLTAVESLIR